MEQFVRYSVNAVLNAAISLPFILLWRYFTRKRLNARGLSSPHKREVWLTVFAVLCVALLSATVLSEFHITSDGLSVIIGESTDRVNLKLFDVIRLVRVVTFERGDVWFLLLNVVGNILVFIPIGLFVCLLWRGPNVVKALLAGLGGSVFIELCQFPLDRGTDIDDLWLNTLGALAGWGIYKIIAAKRDLTEYRVAQKEKE